LEQFGTFVKVEQPAESEKAEKKQKAPKKSKKEAKPEAASTQEAQPTQSLEHNAKTLKPSPSKKKSAAPATSQ